MLFRWQTGLIKPTKTRDRPANITLNTVPDGSMHTTRMTRKAPSNSSTLVEGRPGVRGVAGIEWVRETREIEEVKAGTRCRSSIGGPEMLLKPNPEGFNPDGRGIKADKSST